MTLDGIDSKLIHHLMAHGRATWAELAILVGLSAPATADRVRRLEERGLIVGYAALAAPEALGLGLTAFVAVSLARPTDRAPFLDLVAALPEIQECHHIAGDDDYLLKLRCASTRQLDHLLSDRLKALDGVVRTRTTIVLTTLKETVALPLPPEDDRGP